MTSHSPAYETSVACPKCKTSLHISSDSISKSIRCSSCDHVFTVTPPRPPDIPAGYLPSFSACAKIAGLWTAELSIAGLLLAVAVDRQDTEWGGKIIFGALVACGLTAYPIARWDIRRQANEMSPGTYDDEVDPPREAWNEFDPYKLRKKVKFFDDSKVSVLGAWLVGLLWLNLLLAVLLFLAWERRGSRGYSSVVEIPVSPNAPMASGTNAPEATPAPKMTSAPKATPAPEGWMQASKAGCVVWFPPSLEFRRPGVRSTTQRSRRSRSDELTREDLLVLEPTEAESRDPNALNQYVRVIVDSSWDFGGIRLSQRDLANLTESDLATFDAEIGRRHQDDAIRMSGALPNLQIRFLDRSPVKVASIGNRLALSGTYRRQMNQNEPVQVRWYIVPGNSGYYHVTLSVREPNQSAWDRDFDRIIASMQFSER